MKESYSQTKGRTNPIPKTLAPPEGIILIGTDEPGKGVIFGTMIFPLLFERTSLITAISFTPTAPDRPTKVEEPPVPPVVTDLIVTVVFSDHPQPEDLRLIGGSSSISVWPVISRELSGQVVLSKENELTSKILRGWRIGVTKEEPVNKGVLDNLRVTLSWELTPLLAVGQSTVTFSGTITSIQGSSPLATDFYVLRKP